MNKQISLTFGQSFRGEHSGSGNLQDSDNIYHSGLEQGVSPSLPKLNKPITKSNKPTKKGGRPKNSEDQIKYTQHSNRFSQTIWHFSRVIVFLYLLGEKDEIKQFPIPVNKQRAHYFNQALEYMQSDNFPSFQEWKGDFILHPNSLHSFLQSLKERGIQQVSSQAMKMYLLACLYRRNLVSPSIYRYVSNYWPDIVKLVRRHLNAKRKRENERQRYIQCQEKTNDSKSDLQQELKDDNSIAAYEIVCYIKVCCQTFQLDFQN